MHVCRAPGRLDIMGGNDDYTGGLAFESTIREATWAAVSLRNDKKLKLYNPQMKERGWAPEICFELDEFKDAATVRALATAAPEQSWSSYVAGQFFWLKEHSPDRVSRGADVFISSTVPLNKGVGSSAALEVAVMKAAAHAYSMEMRGIALAEACQWAENVVAGSACGIMDQISIVLGAHDCVLPLLCQPCEPYEPVRINPKLRFWGIDSGVSRAVAGPEYEAARAAAFMGYKLTCDAEGLRVTPDESSAIPRFTETRWNGYLANLQPSEFCTSFSQLCKQAGSSILFDRIPRTRANCVGSISINTRKWIHMNI
jgi:galactokinase